MQILHFLIFLALHFHNVKIQLQLIVISSCCGKSDGLSHDELRAASSTQKAESIIRETNKVEKQKMDQDGILSHSRINGALTM